MQKCTLALAGLTLLICWNGVHHHACAEGRPVTKGERKKKMPATHKPQLLACSLGAMTPAQRQRHDRLGNQIRKAVKQVKELPDGYAFRFTHDPAVFVEAAEFITLESRCCSFFHFTLEKEPDDGPVWLRVTGPKEAKTFIKHALSP